MSIFQADQQELIEALPRGKRVQLVGTLLLYVFKGIKQEGMRPILSRSAPDFDFLAWRRHLHKNGALLRDGKVYSYGMAAVKSPKRRNRITNDVDLHEVDRKLLHDASKLPELQARFEALASESICTPLTSSELDSYTSEVLSSKDLRAYTRSFIREKMSFLIHSYGLPREDLESDLYSWALFTLLKTYPRFEDIGHGLAIAKTAIKNRGINLIKENVTGKKNTLVRNSDGTYSNIMVPLDTFVGNAIPTVSSDDDSGDLTRSELVVGLDGCPRVGDMPFALRNSLYAVCESTMLKPKQRRFLSLLLGNHSEAFSSFLKMPNEDYIDIVDFSVHLRQVCLFMDISMQGALTFLQSLRKDLSDA